MTDIDLIHKLTKVLKDAGLTELEYCNEKTYIKIAKQGEPMVSMPTTVVPLSTSLPAPAVAMSLKEVTNDEIVKSPLVGTVYLASAPGTPPFIKVGDKVERGQVLMIIEAMKVMNPLKSPAAGVVKEIIVSDAKPVEFGEPLVILTKGE